MRHTHGGDNHIRLAQNLVKVLGTGMRQGRSCVDLTAGQQQPQRTTHSNTATEHHHILTVPVDTVAFHQLNHAVRGARQGRIQRLRNVQHQLAKVSGVQTVSVLLRRNLLQNTVSIQVLGQGKLHNIARAGRVVIELINLGFKLFLGDIGGQIYTDRINANLRAVAVFSAHIGV